jgi:hypothetical protein
MLGASRRPRVILASIASSTGMVRLRDTLPPLGVPVDVIVTSADPPKG